MRVRGVHRAAPDHERLRNRNVFGMKKDRYLNRARDLYTRGYSYSEVARELNLSRSTVAQWATEDRENGLHWRQLRDRAQDALPGEVMLTLRRRLARMVMDFGTTGFPDARACADYEKRLLTMTRVLRYYIDTGDDISRTIDAMTKFVEFARSHVSPEEMNHLKHPLTDYMDHLRVTHGG